MSDNIKDLPTDDIEASNADMQIVNSMFKQKQNTVTKILNSSKDVLLVGFLFILLNIPQADDLVCKFIPSCKNSTYILLLVKTLIMMGSYFILKNLYLVKKR